MVIIAVLECDAATLHIVIVHAYIQQVKIRLHVCVTRGAWPVCSAVTKVGYLRVAGEMDMIVTVFSV